MPEGHSVHRIARQFARHFLGVPLAVTSPQGRFALGAARLDGHALVRSEAVGKQLFLEFDHGLWLRVHLGLYGAWDFAGEIELDDTSASAGGRIGQTNQRGTVRGAASSATVVGAHEGSPWSIGAPRRARLRISEQEQERELVEFPPDPVGQVRVRLLAPMAVADLRGPTACEVITADDAADVRAKLGPDPLVGDPADNEARFIARVRKKASPIAVLLMDQSVVSGIGNVYRAELLFRSRIDPFTPGRSLPAEVASILWRDWDRLLRVGVETGQMLTMDDLDEESYARALASRDDRHWVYHRAGEPCRVCATTILIREIAGRKLYWCPSCQAP